MPKPDLVKAGIPNNDRRAVMTTAAHTPGPWQVSNLGIWATSPWNAQVCIASVNRFSPMNGIDCEANAHLIAASPVLLGALNRILDAPKNTMSDGKALREIVTIARAAIAKATGSAA
jgi:hypothetical protein